MVFFEWRHPEALVELLVIDLGDVDGQPAFELVERHRGLLCRRIIPALGGIGKGGARQGMDGLVERAAQPFDRTAEMRSPHRPPVQVDAVFGAGPLQHCTPKFRRAIGVDAVHQTADRPGGVDPLPGQPGLLGQDGPRQAESHRQGAGRVQGEIKTRHPPAEHIDGHGQGGPTDRQPLAVVDHQNVRRGVVDLDHRQRPVRVRKRPGHRIIPIVRRPRAFAPTQARRASDPRDARAAC